jgi:hypothetical protein
MSDERVREVWAYAGIRIGRGSKKFHAWLPPESEELLHFSKLTGRTPGAEYTVMVDRDADGEFQSVALSPVTFTGDEYADRALVEQWQTEHDLAEAKLARDRAERKMKAEPDALELAIQPLRDLRARTCRTRFDRVAFLAMIIESLGQ